MATRRDEVTQAALQILERNGEEGFSMRELARELGVTPMAIYRHVRDKDELVDAVVEYLLGGLPVPASDLPWEERLRQLGHTGRDAVLAHPRLAELLFRRATRTAGAIGFVDAIYCALIDAGVPDAQVPRLERLASTFVLGFAVSESSGRFADAARTGRGWSLPGHHKLQAELALDVDWSAEFNADLSDLIDLVRTRSSRP